ncbi:hypothetical protein F4802DRAFT_338539 [Xylaria palmicola]|nr:hypothetical protein F4802DRAFT_338539 [Xylaria palmicola]
MATKHAPRRLPVEIPLPSKPRDYRPGDGPALAPVRLALEQDTGAFIVDKRILPGEPVNGDLKLELYYVVGWPDLPAARVAILGTKILDYVSPRTLEDWEYKCLLEKDEEQARREAAERKRQEERAKAPAAPTSATGTSTPRSSTPGRGRRGRPSKAEVLARRIAQQASFGDDTLANVPLPPARTHGPSLSTPQKRGGRLSTDAEELAEADVNDAISKQILADSESDGQSQVDEDLDKPQGPVASMGFPSLMSLLPSPSYRGYADFLVPNSPSSTQQDPAQVVSPVPLSLRANETQSLRRNNQLTTPVPVPSYPRQARKKAAAPKEKTITPIPAPSVPVSRVKVPKQSHVVTFTPIPPPPDPVPKLSKSPKRQDRVAKMTPIPLPPDPVPKPSKPSKRQDRAAKWTPIPPPPCPHPSQVSRKEPPKYIRTPIPPPRPLHSEPAKLHNEIHFTPAGRSHGKEWIGADARVERNSQDRTPSKSTGPIIKTASSRKRKRPPPDEEKEKEEEQEWEVKRIEGDNLIEVEGELVQYFWVRWAGKWPPGQNPTWEPEENIPEALVRNYLKGKEKKARSSSSPTQLMKPIPAFKRKYSSVADAFSGEGEDMPMPSGTLAGALLHEDDDYGHGEERFEVTEQTRRNTPVRRLRVDPDLVAELAASFSK